MRSLFPQRLILKICPANTIFRKTDSYSILGFHYTGDEESLIASKAFFARYSRKSEPREPFLGWEVDIKQELEAKK